MRREELSLPQTKTHHLLKEGEQAFGSLLRYKCKQRYLIYQTCLVPTSSRLSCAISIFARAPYKTYHQLVLTLNPVVYLHYYILQSVLHNFSLMQGRSSAGMCEGVRQGGLGQSVWLNTRNFIQPLITESRLLRELLPRGRCAHAHRWWSCQQTYRTHQDLSAMVRTSGGTTETRSESDSGLFFSLQACCILPALCCSFIPLKCYQK